MPDVIIRKPNEQKKNCMTHCPPPKENSSKSVHPQIELRIRDLSKLQGQNCIFQLRPNGYYAIDPNLELLFLAKKTLKQALVLIEQKINNTLL